MAGMGFLRLKQKNRSGTFLDINQEYSASFLYIHFYFLL